jgi:hypothetical protein
MIFESRKIKHSLTQNQNIMNAIKCLFLSLLFLIIHLSLYGQSELELLPEGLVLPRYTSVEINQLPGIRGQCVYNISQLAVFCHDGTSYKNVDKLVISEPSIIKDDDGDTHIETEVTNDIDEIHVTIDGTNGMIIDKLASDDIRINLPTFRNNVVIGENAGNLLDNTTSDNVIIGSNAGTLSNDGDDNVYIGQNAGKVNSTGNDNLYIGNNAGLSDTQGDRNVFVGSEAGRNYNSTSGSAVGNNTFVGFESGSQSTTGSNNTYVGSRSGVKNNGTQNVFLGNGAGANETSVDQRLIIDNNSVDPPLIYGEFDNEILRIAGDLQILPPNGLPNNTHLMMSDSNGNMDEIIRRSGSNNDVVIGDVDNNGGHLHLRAAGVTRLTIEPEGVIKFFRFSSEPLTCDNSNTQNRGAMFYDDSDDRMKYCGKNFLGDFEWLEMN